MEEGRRSIWARSRLFRLAVYSSAASTLVILLDLVARSTGSLKMILSGESDIRELGTVAAIVFWTTFILGFAFQGGARLADSVKPPPLPSHKRR